MPISFVAVVVTSPTPGPCKTTGMPACASTSSRSSPSYTSSSSASRYAYPQMFAARLWVPMKLVMLDSSSASVTDIDAASKL